MTMTTTMTTMLTAEELAPHPAASKMAGAKSLVVFRPTDGAGTYFIGEFPDYDSIIEHIAVAPKGLHPSEYGYREPAPGYSLREIWMGDYVVHRRD